MADTGDPLHKNGFLQWDHKVNLLGEKMQDIDIHCCELCDRPILTYGRMLPCKHIFCWRCAKRNDTKCARCQHLVNRVEQCELGKVFVCVVDTTKDGKDGCKRTYLSLRDLHAHMNYRHRGAVESNMTNNSNPTPQPAIMNMVTTTHSVDTVCQRPSTTATKPPRMSNLITVPLQDARQAPMPQNYNNYVPYNTPSNATPFTRPTFNPNVPPPNYSVTQQLPNFAPHIQTAAAVFAAVGSRNWGAPGTQRPPRTSFY
ncbi:DgyrCDS4356 [Dimorphilus gyrociliatus]|uniref:E3 ubiquitin-protein ligase Hakai n=1 Tax=Dimorphilus gyrociliatus TaxID=2664684 RepID=A0A7I8VJ10_9ANNE|nr:DgyrCDS4356 [Dimorphilus gyrociliatus]